MYCNAKKVLNYPELFRRDGGQPARDRPDRLRTDLLSRVPVRLAASFRWLVATAVRPPAPGTLAEPGTGKIVVDPVAFGLVVVAVAAALVVVAVLVVVPVAADPALVRFAAARPVPVSRLLVRLVVAVLTPVVLNPVVVLSSADRDLLLDLPASVAP